MAGSGRAGRTPSGLSAVPFCIVTRRAESHRIRRCQNHRATDAQDMLAKSVRVIRVHDAGRRGADRAPHAAEASTYRWQAAVGGNWNDPANWTLIEGPAGVGISERQRRHRAVPADFASGDRLTIPDRCHDRPSRRLSFPSAPTSRSPALVRDCWCWTTADGEAQIRSSNTTRQIIDVPIQLNSNLRVEPITPMTFPAASPMTAERRNVTLLGGRIRYTGNVSNTYTGTTTLARDVWNSLGRMARVAIAGRSLVPSPRVQRLHDRSALAGR